MYLYKVEQPNIVAQEIETQTSGSHHYYQLKLTSNQKIIIYNNIYD